MFVINALQKFFILFQLIKYEVAATTTIKSSVSNNNNEGLIANGYICDPRDYPYMVFFRMESISDGKFHKCTGTLISPLFVLTAAHCTDKHKDFEVTNI